MAKATIAEKDIKILEIIAQDDGVSQRGLVDKSGLSLGMVNLVLRRLAKTGYIKMVNLDKRKVQYLLTSKGIKEKTDRSYTYLQRTIRVYKEYRDQVERVIDEELKQGHHRIKVVGEGELADLVKTILKEKNGALTQAGVSQDNSETIVLDCNQLNGKSIKGISVLERVLVGKPVQRNMA